MSLIFKNLQGDIVDKKTVTCLAFALLLLFGINSFASNSLSSFKSEEILYINYDDSLSENNLCVDNPLALSRRVSLK